VSRVGPPHLATLDPELWKSEWDWLRARPKAAPECGFKRLPIIQPMTAYSVAHNHNNEEA
jgi:hypothetical protein